MTAEELVALRKEAGLTQSAVAGMIGMTLRGYQKLESGESPIKQIFATMLPRMLKGGTRFTPTGSAASYALAGFMTARASMHALLDNGIITADQAVACLERFVDDFPDGDDGKEARGLMQGVINAIAKEYKASV